MHAYNMHMTTRSIYEMDCRFPVRILMGLLTLVLIPCSISPSPLRASEVSADSADVAVINSLLKDSCLDCHTGNEPSGGLNLETFQAQHIMQAGSDWDSSPWEKITKRLQARQMPPADAVRPSEETYLAVTKALSRQLDQRAQNFMHPGRTDTLRRLNRTEYQNAIRDLLALEIDATELLPAEEASHGFDNVTVGTLSPVLLNRYITASQLISRLAVGGHLKVPHGLTVRLPPDISQEQHVAGLPLGTRGGALIEHTFPASGSYEISLRLMRDRDENIEGLDGKHQIDILVDREKRQEFQVSRPKNKDMTNVDASLVTRIHLTAGPHAIGVTFPQLSSALEEIKRQPFEAHFNHHRHPRQAPAIYEVSIVGPFEQQPMSQTPSRELIFSVRPQSPDDNHACARVIFEKLMHHAYRRPVTEEDFDKPLAFFEQGLEEGDFDLGIQYGLSAILVNPNFLFRIEQDPTSAKQGDIYPISELELASRLSFFIWSSLPDEQLLGLAEQGILSKPEVLKSQVQRLLQDERSLSLVTNFASQWLYLKNLDSFNPDLREFPDFDDNLRQAFRKETEHLFAHMLREDLSVLSLLDSDVTFLNERLATHYGINHVKGSHFRPVKVTQADHRGGLLRHGSILSVTSYSTRTSPTIRGSWILKNVLGTPPPPPPPNVPALKDKVALENLSVRERLDLHRENPACASCHDLMDPLGFALDNYDATGRWRNFEHDLPIDVSGIMPDGSRVSGIEELEACLLKHPELFVSTLTEKLLTFGLGRGVEASDGPAVRSVVSHAADSNYRFSKIVEGIVLSPPFLMRELP